MTPTRDWAVITGASGDLGQAFAHNFAADGINLVLTARRGPVLASLATQLEHDYGIKTLVYAGDLAEAETLTGLLTAVHDAHIRVKYLINNAGFGGYGAFTKTSWVNEHTMIDVNVSALTYLTKAFAKLMKQKGYGRIMNIASTAAFFPGPNMAVYYASKAYVLSFSEALREELCGSGVTMTTLCPGPLKSGFAEAARASSTRLFDRSLPAAESVASYGYRAMQRGQSIAIYGWRSRLFIWSSRLLPRRLLPSLIKRLH
jgi:short-subunit dehydrogenase